MSKRLKQTAAVLALLLILVGGAGGAKASDVSKSSLLGTNYDSPPPVACSNLDVIFIVDQSASMQRTDPTVNREYAVEGMIDLLVDLAINQCPDSYHRVGVISFGSEYDTHIDVPLYDIDPATSTDARRIRDYLREKVKAANLGTTYPEPAFLEAYRMFNQSMLDSSQPRKKVIIFITDGLPCKPGKECDESTNYVDTTAHLRSEIEKRFPFSSDLKKREDCLFNVRRNYPETLPAEKTTACLEDNPVADSSYSNSTYIYTLLLYNFDDVFNEEAVAQLNEISREHAGELFKNQSKQQIPSNLRKILSHLVGVRPTLLTGPNFAVNPYLNKLIVTAYKQSEEVDLVLSYTDVNGKLHSIQNGQVTDGFILDPDNGYYRFGANERYAILNPYPGVWSMSTSNPNGLDVYYSNSKSENLEEMW